MAAIKTLTFRPFGGPFDTRSNPAEMARNAVRWRQNMAMRDVGRSCRREMFEKLFSATPYNNEDLHDQMLALQTYYADNDPESDGADNITSWPSVLCSGPLSTRDNGREPITFLFDAVSTQGTHTLFSGTTSRIYAYSRFTKSHRIITDGMGDGSSYFKAAQIRNSVFFTNNVDRPFVHQLGQQTQGCARRATSEVSELDDIGLTKAKVVIGWKGLIMLMNVEMDGVRVPNRVVWSDFNKPFSWVPAEGSIAGFQDLDNGEEILNAVLLGDLVMIYTTRGIWQINATGTVERPLTFYKGYSDQDGHRCLHYENCITSIGHAHIYAASDAIYLYSNQIPQPERIEWLHLCTDVMYDDLNTDECQAPVMGFWPKHNEVWISWPGTGRTLPHRTIVANFDENHLIADVVDHGFTAFVNHAPDNQMTLGEFLLTYGICDMASLSPLLVKQGCSSVEVEAICSPTSFRNPPEEIDEPVAEGSLCECLDGLKVEDLCQPCNSEPVFIAASSQDYCLKQIGTAFYKEICTNYTFTGEVNEDGCYISSEGLYNLAGYYSITRTGPMAFGKPDLQKMGYHMLLEAHPEDAVSPARLRTVYGVSYGAFDSNRLTNKLAPYNVSTNPTNDNCAPLWRLQDDYLFECQNDLTPEQLLAAGQLQADGFEWPLLEYGRFHYIEFSIVDPDDNSAPTGGGGCFDRIELSLKQCSECI